MMDTTMMTMRTPLGILRLFARDGALSGVCLTGQIAPEAEERRTDVLLRASEQLRQYFEGERRTFDLPLAPVGTPFQQRVWQALSRIPFGERRSYVDIAREIGRPTASRAVGAANGKNPIAIIVPCHRVIGASGALTGYAGGLPAKRWLLEHERIISARLPSGGGRTPALEGRARGAGASATDPAG